MPECDSSGQTALLGPFDKCDSSSQTALLGPFDNSIMKKNYKTFVFCITSATMTVVGQEGCLSVKYFENLKLLAILDKFGIWTLSGEGGCLTLLFLGRLLKNQMCCHCSFNIITVYTLCS